VAIFIVYCSINVRGENNIAATRAGITTFIDAGTWRLPGDVTVPTVGCTVGMPVGVGRDVVHPGNW
jgi:hypothetical protein